VKEREMELKRLQTELGFDLGRAKKNIDIYSSSVGVDSLVIDSTGSLLYHARGKTMCGFCQKVQAVGGSAQGCSGVHLYGSYQAERFGGKYVFFCPLGLVHWASPITAGGIMKGAVLGGPVLMVEPDEFLFDELLSDNPMSGCEVQDLKESIKEIPVIQPDVVNSLSELLSMVAANISAEAPQPYQEDIDHQEQQAEISEYIQYIKTMGGECSEIESYPFEKEKELLSRIQVGDKAESQRVLNEILGHVFFATGGNFEIIKARVLELIVLLSRAALSGGADVEQIFGLNYKYLSQIHDFRTVEELASWLSGIMNRFTDCVFNLVDVKHIDVIYKAMDYIKRNYKKKITLEEVASHVYLSPSYFCLVFKKELKCNFKTYVNRIRIEMSKKLLLDNSIPLTDIASDVGFEDQSYFTKVFRSLTGTSPGKYREKGGQVIAGSSY
jgi:AraC-like DNA-binding protein/ligand-binding sensor protein